jgi:rhodanese-related sulfurtransferase
MRAFLSRWFRHAEATQPTWIEVAALQARLAAGKPCMLVDVRQPEEYAAPPGHLPDAMNIPLAGIAAQAAALAAAQCPVVLVCKTDRRSAQAAAVLLAAGLIDVAVLRGGTDGWHRQGLPLAGAGIGA